MSDRTSFGAALAALRKKSGYSLEEIAKKTRITVPILKALEAGDVEAAGGVAYARGHIRAIAQMIDIDPTHLLELFAVNESADDRPMIELLEENNATALNPQKNHVSPKVVSIAASLILGVAILIPSGIALTSKSATKHSTKVSMASTSATKKSATTKSTSPVTPAVASDRSVVVTATGGSTWLSVADRNGAFLFSGILREGSTQTFPYDSVASLRVGNAGATSIIAAGQDLGVLGAMGEAKTITIAPTTPSSQG
mgnify:CR=1 FL=1